MPVNMKRTDRFTGVQLMPKREYRDFPVNPDHTEFVSIPVDSQGRPLRKSKEWKTMIANAAAKAPELRSAAEKNALRLEMQS